MPTGARSGSSRPRRIRSSTRTRSRGPSPTAGGAASARTPPHGATRGPPPPTRPGMLVASIERCPVLGGKVRSFDATAAMRVPGIRRVVQVTNGVAVVADTFGAALNGRRALTITWDEGPLAQVSSAQIIRDYTALATQPGQVARKDGDADAVLGSSANVVAATYQVPFLEHA